VDWLSDRWSFAIAVALYGVASVFAALVWRRGFRGANWTLWGLLAGGAVFHTTAMLRRGFSLDRCPIHNLFEATMFIAWTIVAAYFVLAMVPRLRFLGAFAAPVLFALGVFALMPALDPPGPGTNFGTSWAPVHAALVLLAYGAFGVGSLAAGMYLRQEHDLRFDKAQALMALVPSINRLEITTARVLLAGLVLLSGGLVTGSLYLRQERGQWFVPDPFILYSLLTWALYGGLLVAAWRARQFGRRFAWAAVGSFVFLMLTFWGVYLLSGLHNRSAT
jgi:HemX protein